MDENTEQLLKIEVQNVKRIERLETAVGELREDIAALPGKIQQLRSAERSDKSWQWAFGIIITALGSAFLILWQSDQNTRSEIAEQVKGVAEAHHDHVHDRHPTRVEADVKELRKAQELHEKICETKRDVLAERIVGLTRVVDLGMNAMTSYMSIAGERGRQYHETKGRLEASVEALKTGLAEEIQRSRAADENGAP